MKSTRAKRAKLLFFIVKYANFARSCCPRRRGWLGSLKIKISRRRFENYVKKLHQKAWGTCSTVLMLTYSFVLVEKHAHWSREWNHSIEDGRFTAACSRCRLNLKFENLALSFGRLRQGIVLKCMPHVQHDYFSSFNQSDHCFLTSSLPLPSSLSLPISIDEATSFPGALHWLLHGRSPGYNIAWKRIVTVVNSEGFC